MTALLLLRRSAAPVRAAAAPAAEPVVVKSHPALYPGPSSRAQAEAGNYKKRRVPFYGLTLRVENEAGTVREGAGWATRMLFPYGEVEDTEGVDGDRVDCYLGPYLEEATHVFVVHQRRVGHWSDYDEDKCMLGFLTEEEAAIAYLQHYDDPRFLGPITAMPVAEFVVKVRATRGAPAMVKGTWFGGADLLKATQKKMITVPGYTKHDGTYVPPHQKMVHYNPDHSFSAIAQGGVSHSQKEAHKKLAKQDWFAKLMLDDQALHVMSLATEIQDAASASAAVSGWKAAAKAGKEPSAAQWSAFAALPKDKQAALYDEVKKAAGTLRHLTPPEAAPVPQAAEPAPAAKLPLSEIPAWDYLSNQINSGAVNEGGGGTAAIARKWLKDNPGKESELSEALQDLSLQHIAADLDLPAPDDGASDVGVSTTDSEPSPLLYDASLQEAKDGGLPDGWNHGFVENSLMLPADTSASGNHGMSIYANGDGTYKVQMVNLHGEVTSNYPSLSALDAASKTTHMSIGASLALTASQIEAAIGPKEGDTKPGANGDLVFHDGRWHKQDGGEDAGVAKQLKAMADAAYSDGVQAVLEGIITADTTPPSAVEHAQNLLDNLKAKDALQQIPKSGSFYQKEAFKELTSKVEFWGSMTPSAQLMAVQMLYKQKQGAASQSAAVSLWKKALLAGKVPSPAQHKAFSEMAAQDPQKAHALVSAVVSGIGAEKWKELAEQANANLAKHGVKQPAAFAQPAAKGPTPTPAPVADPGAPPSTDAEWYLALAKQHGLLGGSAVKSAINLAAAGNVDGLKTVKTNLSPIKKNMHGFLAALIQQVEGKAAPAADALPASWEQHKTGASFMAPDGTKITVQLASTLKHLIVIQNSAAGKVLFHNGGLFLGPAMKAIASLTKQPVSPAIEKAVWTILDEADRLPAPEANQTFTPVKPAAPAPSSVTMTAPKTVYTNTSDGHNKQWAVYVAGNKLVTEFGPIGKTQQKSEKVFANADAAHAGAMKLIKEKKAKGYYEQHTDYTHKVSVTLGAAAKPQEKPDITHGSTFAVAATKVEKMVAIGDAGGIESELQAAWGLKSKNAVAFQNYALAAMVGMGAHKPEFVSDEQWASGSVDAGPKDGDTKQGADGTLVFKDGRWHKLNKPGPKLSKAEINEAVPSLLGMATNGKAVVAMAKEFAASGDFDYVQALYIGSKHGNMPKTTGALGALVAAMKKKGATPFVPDPYLLGKIDDSIKGSGANVEGIGGPFMAKLQAAKVAALKGDMATLDKVYAAVKSTVETSKAVLAIMAAVNSGSTPAQDGEAAAAAEGYKPKPTTAPSDASPVVPKMAPAGAVKPGEPGSMKGWVQTGPQKGSNPGGQFKDKNGQLWYVKFPKSGDVAKNELLASKFYQMLGVEVPFLRLVEQDGKVGVASKWNPGVKKGSAASLAAAEGAHEGFVFDAWLANWDAVGPDFMNMQLAGNKAVRVDVGGSLLYRAQGGKKTDFGENVLELESLLDASKNAATAATFKGVGKKALDAGLQKMNMLKPSQIEELCEKIGPGSAAERKQLAATLIARRAFILKKYGIKDQWASVKSLDPTKLPVKAADLPKPLDYFSMNGGKGKSSKAWKNAQNNKVSADLVAFAAKGDLVALKNYQYAEITDNEAGTPTGKMKSITEHPSKEIQEQWVGLVELLQSIATPSIPTLEMPSMGAVGALDEISDFVGSFSPTERPETVATEHRMGFFMALGQIEDIHGLLAGMKWSFIQKGGAWTQKMKAGFASLSALTRSYISSVQSSGSINHAWSQGKTQAASTPLQKLTAEIYKSAVDIPEGTVLRRGMSDTTAGKIMSKQLLAAKPGLVIQNTDSMCTSFNETHSWGGDVQMTIRCAKGCKATPSFASGGYSSEYEITTLPGQRYVVLGVEKTGSGVKLDVLMLPPHEGFIAEVGKLAKMGKALQSAFLLLRRWF